MRAERVRWRLTQRGCFWRSWTSSSLQDGEVKKQPVFDDQKVRTGGARAVELPRVSRTTVPAKHIMRRIGAGLGHIRARKLRVAARGGSGALAGSARWLRASRGGVRRAAGRSATHLARNAGRPGGKPRAHANAGGLTGAGGEASTRPAILKKRSRRPRSFILYGRGFSRCE